MLLWIEKKTFIGKYFFRKTEIDRILIISSLFSLLLLAIKIVFARRILFLFLPWNLLLAYIPYAISGWISKNPSLHGSKWKLLPLIAVWLLFIPNSFYIITDLFHLDMDIDSPRWFDLTLIFSFAWNGLLLGILSVRHMEKIIKSSFRIGNSLFFIYPVMWLNALGIFIGRYLRFNSWDIIASPFRLLEDIADMILHPFHYGYGWGMIFIFSVFMTLVYIALKEMSKNNTN